MSKKFVVYTFLWVAVFFAWTSCTSQKNTAVTRWYHATNTRYNIQFNGQVAYDEALKVKNEAYKDNMTELINVFPFEPASLDKKAEGGAFNKVIDKCVKAIKLHSIEKKPEKDPKKRGNTAYQRWFNQREFNPFLCNSWMLMAKSEYQNNDLLKSISTFSYITRLFSNNPDIVAEARIWMVKAYGNLGWYYQAEDILKKMELSGPVPKSLQGEYAAAYANLLIRQKKYREAVPYLETASEKAENHQQGIRYKYLLGQIYETTGNRQLALKAYNSIFGLNTPFVYELNSKLKRTENSPLSESQKSLSMLDGMAKEPKNKEYLDQVYFTKGNIQIQQKDTMKAIGSYETAIAKSKRNGAEKARVQVTLGDLYFQRQQYIKAQPCYSGALSALAKDHEDYPRVALRSQVLEQLAKYDQDVKTQDSLQALARMQEVDRLKVINKVIADLAKKEDKLLAEKEKAESNIIGPPGMAGQVDIPVQVNTQGGFYFDNQQSIAQGKNSFEKKWGTRKLEDNWRRRDKTVSIFAEQPNVDADAKTPTDSAKQDENDPVIKKTNDPHSPDYYLAQLPFKQEQIDASNKIIDEALFQMGGIYRDQLSDPRLAIHAYESELDRFPSTPNKEEVYFRLYMLYHELGNKAMTENYRRKTMVDFPKGNYAKSFAEPNYEWNLQNPKALQDSLYERTYAAYLRSDINTVRKGYTDIQEKHPQSELMPKFMFLNALTYAQTKDEEKFRNALKAILAQYPQADVTPVATDMLKGSVAGKVLAGGAPVRGMIWNTSFGKEETLLAQQESTIAFKPDEASPQLLLLVYPLKKTNKNDLLYALADYNFSHYVLSTFDLIFDDQATTGILQVKGFSNFRYLKQYVDDATKNGLFNTLGTDVVAVPISVNNYSTLLSGKTLNEYFDFFNQQHGAAFPQLIALWQAQQKMENDKTRNDMLEAQNSSSENVPSPIEEKTIGIPPAELVKTDESSRKDINISNIKVQNSASKDEKSPVENEKKDEEKVTEAIDNTFSTVQTVYNNPVEGLKGILKNIVNKPKLTKEEKAEQKRIDKEQKAEKARLSKIERELEQTRKDSIAAVLKTEKMAQREIEQKKQDSIKSLENEKRSAQLTKENAQKARAAELKEKELKRNQELKAKKKAREEKLKAREKELKEKERLQKEKQKEKEKQNQRKQK